VAARGCRGQLLLEQMGAKWVGLGDASCSSPPPHARWCGPSPCGLQPQRGQRAAPMPHVCCTTLLRHWHCVHPTAVLYCTALGTPRHINTDAAVHLPARIHDPTLLSCATPSHQSVHAPLLYCAAPCTPRRTHTRTHTHAGAAVHLPARVHNPALLCCASHRARPTAVLRHTVHAQAP